ncbi:MAG: AAA family ATPase [Ilumatobacteraceae bacterium]
MSTRKAPVVAVVSPKGGNGKTTVSSSLAVALGRRHETVLVDLDVHFGDVEYALRFHPIHRLDDAVRRLQENSKVDLSSLLATHPTGVEALCAPSNPVEADRIEPAEAFAVVDRLIELGRPVVLDTAGGISDYTLGALDRATHIVLVSGTDVPSVQAGRKLIDTMTQLEMSVSKVHLVVNRSTTRVGLSVKDVEAVLGMSAVLEVPEHPSVAAAMNQGSPVTESSPQGPIARAFFDFSDRILGVDDVVVRRRFAFGGKS